MSYASILVHLDTSEPAQRRLDLAFRLAHRFGAHLHALLTFTPLEWTASDAMAGAVERLIERERNDAEQARLLAQRFKAEAAHMKISAEWTESNGDPNETVPVAARLNDLVITGQPDTSDSHAIRSERFAGNLVLRSGRPVLFVPYAGTFAAVGTRVLIGWDGSREAARAVADATPFICRAIQNAVVTVNALQGESIGSRVPGADIAPTLARHSAHVETYALEAVRPSAIGDTLLSRAADLGSDLLVMGGYGHMRWRELVLGGTTQDILRTMTLPVLMSH